MLEPCQLVRGRADHRYTRDEQHHVDRPEKRAQEHDVEGQARAAKVVEVDIGDAPVVAAEEQRAVEVVGVWGTEAVLLLGVGGQRGGSGWRRHAHARGVVDAESSSARLCGVAASTSSAAEAPRGGDPAGVEGVVVDISGVKKTATKKKHFFKNSLHSGAGALLL